MYEYETNKHRVKDILFIGILIIVVFGGIILIYDMLFRDTSEAVLEQKESNIKEVDINKEEKEENEIKDITEIIEEVNKSIVGISKIKSNGTSIFLKNSTDDLGIGTGFIVSKNGYILTNWHVVGNKYSNCYVTLDNSKSYTGIVEWADKDLDLALVKINAIDLECANLGNSENIKIGQEIYAIGNPIGFEFQRTVTHGIISGLNRTIKLTDEEQEAYMEDLIQTDATINNGNSGGPLINKKGEVIGVSTVKISDAEAIGFAMPINIVKPVIESFEKKGSFDEAYLGVFAYDKEVIPYLNFNINFESGVYVAAISKDGPASKTGLKIGDVITKIDDKEINKMSELRSYIYTKKPGEEINLTVLRNNKEYVQSIALGKK